MFAPYTPNRTQEKGEGGEAAEMGKLIKTVFTGTRAVSKEASRNKE
jgi:hypothetical protein